MPDICPTTGHRLPPAPLTDREQRMLDTLRAARAALLRTEGLTRGAELCRRDILRRIEQTIAGLSAAPEHPAPPLPATPGCAYPPHGR